RRHRLARGRIGVSDRHEVTVVHLAVTVHVEGRDVGEATAVIGVQLHQPGDTAELAGVALGDEGGEDDTAAFDHRIAHYTLALGSAVVEIHEPTVLGSGDGISGGHAERITAVGRLGHDVLLQQVAATGDLISAGSGVEGRVVVNKTVETHHRRVGAHGVVVGL